MQHSESIPSHSLYKTTSLFVVEPLLEHCLTARQCPGGPVSTLFHFGLPLTLPGAPALLSQH
jgi:hypothetical protein